MGSWDWKPKVMVIPPLLASFLTNYGAVRWRFRPSALVVQGALTISKVIDKWRSLRYE